VRRFRSKCPRTVVPVVVACVFLFSSCSTVIAPVTSRVTEGLTSAVLDHNDPETVRQGAPAYLLMVDAMIAGDPDNTGLLIAGAQLYSSYTSGFVSDQERASRLAERGRSYGWRGLCEVERATCDSWELPFDEFQEIIDGVQTRHVPALFAAGVSWATWVQVNRADWLAVADKARVEAMMQRVTVLDEDYRDGSAFTYLGVLNSIIPAALGGKPEQGRKDFERAIELAQGRDLMTKVLLAQEYARMVFDRELHDRLLSEVIEADPNVPGLVLLNSMAQAQARILLAESDAYFEE
jgi:TRAP transporter T-component